MSNHPSENAAPAKIEVGPKSDPILIWYGLIHPRLDAALSSFDQAYRDAKIVGRDMDIAARDARKERENKVSLDSDQFLEVEPDALHRTHLRAMDAYASLASALASSVRDVMGMQSLEIEERIVSHG